MKFKMPSFLKNMRKNTDIIIKNGHNVSVFRKNQNLFLREYSSSLNLKTILNAGSKPNASDKEGQTYEQYFKGKEFYSLDIENIETDQKYIMANLLDLSRINIKFDLVLLMSVLEHVKNPFIAAAELRRIILPSSYIYLAVPFFYPVHKGGETDDYWRFTPEAIKEMFSYCKVLELDFYPSVIKSVADRPQYWNEKNTTYTGFSMLLQNQK